MDDPLPLMTQKQLSEFVGVPERTLERWRSEQQGPPYVQLVHGGAIRYIVNDVADWLASRRVVPTRNSQRIEGSEHVVQTWSTRKE